MANSSSQTFQIKLAFDEGLRRTWDKLTHEYEALDKASIVRLALNTLAKQIQKPKPYTEEEEKELFAYFDMLNKSNDGPTEEEFFKWWNENKKSLK